MNQQLFSSIVLDFLQRSHPSFLSTLNYSEDGSFQCSVKSRSNKFAMWIATDNQEITYGFVSPDGKSDIHSHISCCDFADLPECLETLTSWINRVEGNITVIYLSDSGVWDWIDRYNLSLMEKDREIVYEKCFWKEFSN